jgi:GrpB-like predicted nucleotidyltransferase (UPF0157 family)
LSGDHRHAEGTLSEEVDLIVVHDHKLADEIVKALEHAGIHHVEFWPEHMLDRGMRVHHTQDEVGPFHIRVRGDDLQLAQVVLSSSGLTES